VVNIEKLFLFVIINGVAPYGMLYTMELSKPLSFILGKASGLMCKCSAHPTSVGQVKGF
jgi:hypothetical protein